METKLYVGNLAYDITEDNLRSLFTQVGTVNEVTLIKNYSTGSSKGFAFVTMDSQEDGNKAIEKFHGRSLGVRELTVKVARPMKDRQSSRENSYRRVWNPRPNR